MHHWKGSCRVFVEVAIDATSFLGITQPSYKVAVNLKLMFDVSHFQFESYDFGQKFGLLGGTFLDAYSSLPFSGSKKVRYTLPMLQIAKYNVELRSGQSGW